MKQTILILALAATTFSGCAAHKHMDRGRPGYTELEKPPRAEPGFTAPQRDPGEEVMAVTGGFTPNGGIEIRDGEVCGTAVVAGELTLNYGENTWSHNEDDFFLLPMMGRGASLGGGLRFLDDETLRAPVYVEAHVFDGPSGIAAGWAVDAATGETGPQATVWWGPMFLRGSIYLNGPVILTFGSQLKVPLHAWVWSR
jgi:hypothetical protein